MERAVALASGHTIDVDDLPEFRAAARPAADPAVDFPPDGVDLDRLMSDYERAIVVKALERAGGVRKKAAALLGITFRSLRYRLDKLGFDKADDAADDE
jgi:two-component system response regulator PilR (NtrC family)